jgi:hypothetical protein
MNSSAGRNQAGWLRGSAQHVPPFAFSENQSARFTSVPEDIYVLNGIPVLQADQQLTIVLTRSSVPLLPLALAANF